MLSKTHRLKKKEIENVFKKGRTYRGNFLILKIKKNSLSLSRWSFIVPLPAPRTIVKRNKFKRQLRENLRKKLKIIKPGFDGIILSLPAAFIKKYWEVDKEIDKLLRLANIYE